MDRAKIEALARKRAEYLASAYDIDESTREAFINDFVLELISCAQAFVDAIDKVAKANTNKFFDEATNRKARRAIEKAMRRK